jgi:hypothetical protein
VLNPAGLWEILPEFLVSAARDGAGIGNDESRDTGGTGVDCENAHGH